MGTGALQKIEILNDHTKTQSDAGLYVASLGFLKSVSGKAGGVCVSTAGCNRLYLAQKISATRRAGIRDLG